MSQFMLCKSTRDLTEQKCVRAVSCKDNKEFYIKVIKEVLGTVSDDIWAVPNIDSVFTRAQNRSYPFETTELYSLLSELFDICEVLILWYSNDYQDLDNVNTKEQLFSIVKKSIMDSMCECYVYVNGCGI